MKKIKLDTAKLKLEKERIIHLNSEAMQYVVGGTDNPNSYLNCPSLDIQNISNYALQSCCCGGGPTPTTTRDTISDSACIFISFGGPGTPGC